MTDRVALSALQALATVHPVTDDMALCHPSLDPGTGKLVLIGMRSTLWFLRVNHIDHYRGRSATLAVAWACIARKTAFLITMPSPTARANSGSTRGFARQSLPNPRSDRPARAIIPHVVQQPVEVEHSLASACVCPACTCEKPTLESVIGSSCLRRRSSWLLRRLVARGPSNPSSCRHRGHDFPRALASTGLRYPAGSINAKSDPR